ncbi:uncharacterized protein purg isoform X1 [Hypomesus transpacificus]|uniref:uncharacterized protein purg isoform X1 n=2 Tax=Hypomesus transpacificus TaxID=137520 RepID=UPI001F076786|nr:uncharacterized protein purg isoform X1 [Hypomesus transpacificus]XP_046907156.1 uncharacterized protein purg isoform X1 [Hypomesus transpacificus]XP_046907157.1 uncharacterized protein purg isoform X1 [Hypomesus transpacificus]XP_046907158.1 uncharacterized protein purg isoform X1 [Hypomesus transpacificus]XP_046907159.1 uncharacterized protein purg isoform X1 [Hypomesus transpacificus]XP_046907160.1 uncharacterized protein purg isoform X1 [Hypomesus transpacificus]XP_046907161.1 uncharac
MEKPTCKKEKLSSRESSCATLTPTLKNFTIPRKKRGDGKALLESCPEESRDYSLVKKILSDSRIDPCKEISAILMCEEVKLIHNEELQREFSEKRAEMRSKDRHVREMEESFCFLVMSDQKAEKIFQQGLSVGDSDQHCLGNPSHGVYLHKRADVALKNTSGTTPAGNVLIIFKVLLGKVKKVIPNLRKSNTHDPVVNYDCHVSRDPAGPQDNLSQQVFGSSVFLFDYNDKQELTPTPRQCLPYAVVSLAPAVHSTPSTLMSIPIRPRELEANLKTCTVAERWGKGQNATVKFKHFGASKCLGYKSQGLEGSPFYQNAEQPISHGLSKDPNTSQQDGKDQLLPSFGSWAPQSCFSSPLDPTPPDIGSIPFLNSGLFPHSDYAQFLLHRGLTQMEQNNLQSSHHVLSFQQAQSSLSINQDQQWQLSDIPTAAVLEKCTSVVYSSRVIKDPRMLRRLSSTTQTSSYVDSGGQQTETDTSEKELMEKAKREKLHDLPNQNNNMFANETRNVKQYHTKGSCTSASKINYTVASPSVTKNISENQPSYRMLKMKFKKYSAYLHMSKNERATKIWSLENLSFDEKKILFERINFYEKFYQKYKKGDLVQNDKKTKVNHEASSKPRSERGCLTSLTGKKSHKQHTSYQHISKWSPRISIPEPSKQEMTLPLQHLTLSQDTNKKQEDNQVKKEHFRAGPIPVNLLALKGDLSLIDVHRLELERTAKSLDIINRDSLNQPSLILEPSSHSTSSHCSIQIKRKGEGQAKSCGEIEFCEQPGDVDKDTLPFIFPPAITIPYASAGSTHFDPQTQIQSEVVTQMVDSMGDKQDENVKSYSSMHNSVMRHQHKTVTDVQNQETVSPSSKGILQEMEERSDLDLMMVQMPEYALYSGEDTSTSEYIFESHTDIIGACEEVNAMETDVDAVSTVCPLIVSDRDLEKSIQTTNIQNTKGIPLYSGVTEDRNSHPLECVNDAIYSFLRSRFELGQLVLSSAQNTEFFIPRKHYLKPKDVNSPLNTCTSPPQPCNINNFIRDVHCNLCITIKADMECSPGTESCTLIQKTFKGGVLKATTTYKDRLKSHNVKLIKIMAEKYNVKENESFGKMRDHVQVMKSSKGFPSRFPQTDLSIESQTSLSISPKKRKWSNVIKKRNSKLDTFPFELRRSIRNRSKGNKNSQSTAHKSEINTSKTAKPVTMQEKKRVIIKIIKDFRRTSSWWTFSHRLNSNRMHRNKFSYGPVRSDRKREITSVNKKLPSTDCSARDTSNRELKTLHFPQHTLSTLEYVDVAHSSHEKLFTYGNVLENDKPLENALQEGTPEEETNGNLTTMTQAEEIPSVSDIMEYPLDAAIEILCGSEVKSATNFCTPKPCEVMTQGLPQTQRYDRTEEDVTSNHSTTPSKEVKLISQLRDFLTRFELTVQKEETKSHSDNEEENVLHICGTSQKSDSDAQKQPVQLVVLDRVELPNLRQFTCEPLLNSTVKSQAVNATEIQSIATECNQFKISSQSIKPHISQFDVTNPEQGLKAKDYKNVECISCISPDSTSMLEVAKGSTQVLVSNSNLETNSEITTSVPATEQQCNSNSNTNKLKPQFDSEVEKPKENDNMKRQNVRLKTLFRRDFSVADISYMLQDSDKATSSIQLIPMRSHCKVMLQYFILNFEKMQNVEAKQIVVTRDLVLEKYINCPPQPVELKYEALNSFLELQMMLEAWQFVDNKMRYFSGEITFRSLLWYDPTLYGELFKGKVGFQQQSCLYSSFQQSLATNGLSALQNYHMAVSKLNVQLQRAPNMSYYMYLKSKRERLEVEAVLRNPTHLESFYLSVPVSCMINFGDNVESLERAKNVVNIFTDIPGDQLEGGFDVGKAEHLAIMCRLLQEKIYYLKAVKNTMLSKISWIGMEHILYDASKTMVGRDGKPCASHELLRKYRKTNPHIVIGVTEYGESLFNTRRANSTHQVTKRVHPRQQTRNLQDQVGSTEDNHCAQKAPEDIPTAIALTCEPSPKPPDVRSNKTKRIVNRQVIIPSTHLQPGKHQAKLNKTQVVHRGEGSYDIQGLQTNITAPFSPQIVPPYPEIRACLLNKGVKEVDTLMQLPAALRGTETHPHRQCLSRWPPHNRTGHDPRQMQPSLSRAVRDSQPRETIFSKDLKEQTGLPRWSNLPSPQQLPLSMPPSRSATQMQLPNHISSVCEPSPINYPFFLLNGQTYATVNPITTSPAHDNGATFLHHHM